MIAPRHLYFPVKLNTRLIYKENSRKILWLLSKREKWKIGKDLWITPSK